MPTKLSHLVSADKVSLRSSVGDGMKVQVPKLEKHIVFATLEGGMGAWMGAWMDAWMDVWVNA